MLVLLPLAGLSIEPTIGGSAELVVKLLVVLAGALGASICGDEAMPFVFGGLRLVFEWLWPLWSAGLPQGSASGKLSEFLRISRGGAEEAEGVGFVAGGGVAGRWAVVPRCSCASYERFNGVDAERGRNEGCGRSCEAN